VATRGLFAASSTRFLPLSQQSDMRAAIHQFQTRIVGVASAVRESVCSPLIADSCESRIDSNRLPSLPPQFAQ
jgi:hypothetical protein